MGRKPKEITLAVDEVRIAGDLRKYQEKAIELGATRAKIVHIAEIPVDDRVRMKCQIPLCFGYGVSANCPPNTMKPAELRSLLEKYQSAVFFVKEIPSEVVVRDKATIKERIAAYQDVYKIVNGVESAAFYDGHYLAFGFGAGSCRHTFCAQQEDCAVMKGTKCRFSLRSRPSMEAVGIDVFKMIASAGWSVYPIGSDAKPDEFPCGVLAGIIIVR
jgi:predicted metal-binding protein